MHQTAEYRYNIPDDMWPLVAHLPSDQKASLNLSAEEWAILARNEERRKAELKRSKSKRKAVPSNPSLSISSFVEGGPLPAWSTLGKRVKHLLAGLTVFADDPTRQIASASYKDLVVFLGEKSEPQVPAAASQAKKCGVLEVWMTTGNGGTGRNTYLFPFYVEALALGLALKCSVEISVNELRRTQAEGTTFREIRDRYLESAAHQARSSPDQVTYPPVDDAADVENFPVDQVGEMCAVDEQTYPTGDDGGQYSEVPTIQALATPEPTGSKSIPLDTHRDSCTLIHTRCGRPAQISTRKHGISTKLTGIHTRISPHCTKPTKTTSNVFLSIIGEAHAFEHSTPNPQPGSRGPPDGSPERTSMTPSHLLPTFVEGIVTGR